MIADRVATAKAKVSHYFKAKHDILYENHDGWIDGLIALFETCMNETSDTRARLHAVFRDLLFLSRTKPDHVRVFFENFRELPPHLQASARVKRDRDEQMVEGTISKGMQEGLIIRKHPRTTAFALFGMCNWAYQWYRPGGRPGHLECRSTSTILMNGVEVPEQPQTDP